MEKPMRDSEDLAPSRKRKGDDSALDEYQRTEPHLEGKRLKRAQSIESDGYYEDDTSSDGEDNEKKKGELKFSNVYGELYDHAVWDAGCIRE
jgi:hypothetical protein